jgi:UDP-N-acetylglucosamine 1-carboxyvinyltransferase
LENIFVSGGVPLTGTVRISGSKNSALAVMAGALLAEGPSILRNVPNIGDIHTMVEMLQAIGIAAEYQPDGTLTIDATDLRAHEAPYELVKRMRASFSVLGPMLARIGAARVALPGGCAIGARPVDYHVKGLVALGARIHIEHGFVEAEADGLRGNLIYLDFPSAGATTHLITAAALAEGVTTIENAAAEPEVIDLADYLTKMGARIEGAGTKKITIEGVRRLQGVEHNIIPDRIEAGTFALAAMATGGEVILEDVIPEHMKPLIAKLREAGAGVAPYGTSSEARCRMKVWCAARPRAVDVLAMPHPGFPTDLQQPIVAVLSRGDGTSVITDHVFENRFKYVTELQRMGADIRVEGRSAIVKGVERLSGAQVAASDLRAGAALVIAALAADGQSTITGLEYLDRGYGHLVEKLADLGADIARYDADRAPLRLCAV